MSRPFKYFWRRITLEHTRQPGDKSHAPWYAYPLTAVFVVAIYAVMQTLDAAGY